jgi:hypothetical protein
MGSRYGGLKQIDPMGPNGETVLDYSVYDALRAGFGRVVFVIRRDFEAEFRKSVGSKFEHRADVDYVFQQLDLLPPGFSVPPGREKPWGTTHAIWCAREAVDAPFLAINADDFYGLDAYRQLGAFLTSPAVSEADPARFAMAGFRLDNTLSDFGSVARGVCAADENGKLVRIEELMSIERLPDGSIANRVKDQPDRPLTGKEPVSMNFWGFTPAIFPMLDELLQTFLREQGNQLKSECYIPLSVASLIGSGKAVVDVIPTSSQWFGVTYKEDKPRVVAAIAKLIEQGDYPAHLWAK